MVVDSSNHVYFTASNQVKSVLGQKTIAGTGTPGSSGDGGPATSAQLNGPKEMAVDISGNLYITDNGNHKIRMVTSTGIISTIAGTGIRGFNSDGGAATSAQMNGPTGIAIDALGQLYIADEYNHKIRMVSSTGIITTIVGTGTQGSSGDDGAATSAQLNYPMGVAIGSNGNLYIADGLNIKIRSMDSAGIITTFAVLPGLSSPFSVAWDNVSGSLYVVVGQNILLVSSAGIVTTIAGTGVAGLSGDGGPASAAALYYPRTIVVDAKGREPDSAPSDL